LASAVHAQVVLASSIFNQFCFRVNQRYDAIPLEGSASSDAASCSRSARKRKAGKDEAFTAAPFPHPILFGHVHFDPDFHPRNSYGKTVTLRQLMAHRSWLVRKPPVGNYFGPSEPSLAQTTMSLKPGGAGVRAGDSHQVFERGRAKVASQTSVRCDGSGRLHRLGGRAVALRLQGLSEIPDRECAVRADRGVTPAAAGHNAS
jgi:hypothetical protein